MTKDEQIADLVAKLNARSLYTGGRWAEGRKNVKDAIGKRFGEWTVIADAGVHPRHGCMVVARCSCGTERKKLLSALKHERVQFCRVCWRRVDRNRPRRPFQSRVLKHRNREAA